MATVIEIQETKVEGLCEQAEKVMKHARKLMECLESVKREKGGDDYYMERYDKRRRSGKYDHDDYEHEYYRY